MAKAVLTKIKVNLKGAEASPAPPLGPALGQHGVAIMEFVNQYNAATKDKKGEVIPAVITIYEDRSFTFETKLAPVTDMIKKTLGLDKGSGEAPRKKVGKLTKAQVEEIAKAKMEDLNTDKLESAVRIVEGSARSMSVDYEE